jgi:class 3 adenylate cyclase
MRLDDSTARGVPAESSVSGSDVSEPRAAGTIPARRRRLRAIFAADVANFGGLVSVDETNTLDALWITRRVATDELATYGGWLFGLPGDGVFALFESTVDAVRCALRIQSRLVESAKLHALKLRIGVHLGEVLFRDELPFGEALVIASRLESLAEPGGILVSSAVMDSVASHIAATFVECGVPTLKHSPRRIETFRVLPPPPESEPRPAAALLDRTVAPEPRPPVARPGLVKAPAVARLPKATPLALPSETTDTDRAPPGAPPGGRASVVSAPTELPARGDALIEAHADLDDASLDRLARLLTSHIGPVARMLVPHQAEETRDPAQLIRILALEIPSERERLKFLTGAKAVLSGPH